MRKKPHNSRHQASTSHRKSQSVQGTTDKNTTQVTTSRGISTRERNRLYARLLQNTGRIVGQGHLDIIECAASDMLEALEPFQGESIFTREDFFDDQGHLTAMGQNFLIWERSETFAGDETLALNYHLQQLSLLLDESAFRYFEAKFQASRTAAPCEEEL